MIQTTLQQLARYAPLHPRFAAAFAVISRMTGTPFCTGITEIDGKNLYVNAISYETRPRETSLFEAHRAYIDIMYLKSGCEAIAWYPAEQLTDITTPYDAAGDVLLAALEPGSTRLEMKTGDIAIFFPEDAHCPGLQLDQPQHVEKIIVKVRVSQ